MTINAKSLYQPMSVLKLCAQSLLHLFLLLVWININIGRKVVHQRSIFSQLVNVGLFGYGTQKGILLQHDYLLETSWKYLLGFWIPTLAAVQFYSECHFLLIIVFVFILQQCGLHF